MTAVISANTTTVKRSWADIVKGDVTSSEIAQEIAPEEETSKSTVQPAARGTYLCQCFGEVLVMLGYYGWIKPFEEIDHPDAAKTGGRIYVHKRDIKGEVKLVQGDVVSFYLYSDDQGLGAEYCQLEQRHSSDFRVDAEEFVPTGGLSLGWNLSATEFIPSFGVMTTRFNADAPEFDPSAFANKNTFTSDFTPQAVKHSNLNVSAINPAFLSDDESEDGSSSFNDADVSSNGDKESISDETDLSSEHSVEVESDDDIAVVHVPLIAKGSASDGSTSVGGTSDSEPEDAMAFVSPPPGLELLAGFRPPPGLCL